MSNIEEFEERIFDDIRHIDEFGQEYWEARELMPLLEYSKWENFHKVIKRAMIACQTYYNVWKTVRKAIEELGGNMPETLPTPEKSIKELEKEELKKIAN